jgi:hypothetical protein
MVIALLREGFDDRGMKIKLFKCFDGVFLEI